MMSSTLMPSASALKVGTMRWRRTGGRERFDVVDRDVEASAQHGADFAGEHEVLAGARAGAPVDELFHEGRRVGFVRAGVAHQVEDEIHDVLGHRHFAHDFLQLQNLRAVSTGSIFTSKVPVVRARIWRSSSRLG